MTAKSRHPHLTWLVGPSDASFAVIAILTGFFATGCSQPNGVVELDQCTQPVDYDDGAGPDGLVVAQCPEGAQDPETTVECVASCPGGGCTVLCPEGNFDCRVDCPDGNCTTYCRHFEPGSCVVECEGGGCTTYGPGGAHPSTTVNCAEGGCRCVGDCATYCAGGGCRNDCTGSCLLRCETGRCHQTCSAGCTMECSGDAECSQHLTECADLCRTTCYDNALCVSVGCTELTCSDSTTCGCDDCTPTCQDSAACNCLDCFGGIASPPTPFVD